MSGTIGAREDRQVIPQAVGTADLSRDFSLAGSLAARQGEQIAGLLTQAGTLAANAGSAEAARAGAESAMLEPLQRDEQGRLAPPDLRQRFWLGSGEARRREVLATRYGAEFLNDNIGRFLELRQNAGGDPQAFMDLARAHRDGVIEAIPAVIRPAVMQGMDQEIRRHVQSMQAEKLARDHRAAQEAVQANLTRGVQDLTTSLASGSYVDRVVQYESGGDPNVAATTSSARGAGQFINRTWLAFARSNPALFEGLSQDQILARRSDPALSRQAIVWYAEKNAAALRAAGVAPTEAALALSHQFDGPVAARMLKADPATPVEQIVGAAAVAANRWQLEGKTVGEVVGTFRRRFGDAPPADGQIDSQVRGIVGQVRQAVAANLMSPQAGEDAIRRVTQVLPLTIRTLQQGVVAGDGAGAMVQALIDGPGSPGWRVEWNALREPERRELAQLVQASLSHRRSEANYARLTTEREASVEIVRLSQELTALNERAEGGRLPDADMRRRAELTQRISELSLVTRSDAGVQAIRGSSNADQRAEVRRGAEGEARTVIGRSLTDIIGGDRSDGDDMTGAQARAVVEALRPYADLPLASQARMLAADVREAEQRERAAARANEPRVAYAQALAAATGNPAGYGAARLENSPTNQTVQLEFLPNPTNLLDPANVPSLVIGGRTGVVQQSFAGLAAGALTSGSAEQFTAMAQLHQAMMADPVARDRWMSVLDPRLVAAYSGAAPQLAMLNPRGPEYQQQIERLIGEARRVARGDPKMIEELRAQFPDIETFVTEDREKALKEAGGAAMPPPEMTSLFNASYLRAFAANGGQSRDAARMLAMQEVQREFNLSTLGMHAMMPDAIDPSAREILMAVGADYKPTPRWVRQRPEDFPAPYGARGTPGMRWLVEHAGDLFRRHVPREAGNLRLGDNAWVQLDAENPTMQVPDPRDPTKTITSPAYRVWFRQGGDRRGMLNQLLERDASGQVTWRPVRIPLLAEQLRHQQRWIDSGGAARAEQGRMNIQIMRDEQMLGTGSPFDSLRP